MFIKYWFDIIFPELNVTAPPISAEFCVKVEDIIVLSGELLEAMAPPSTASLFSKVEESTNVFLLLSTSSIAPPLPVFRLLLLKYIHVNFLYGINILQIHKYSYTHSLKVQSMNDAPLPIT